MSRARKIVVVAARSGALALTAFWLVATSQVPKPARECFTGIADNASLQLQVGAVHPTRYATCGGADGIATGAAPVLDLSKMSYATDCTGYDLDGVHGISGVTPDHASHPAGYFVLAFGTFVSPQAPDCHGSWSLRIQPGQPVPANTLVSPLDASAAQPWVLDRWISYEDSAACKAAVGFAGYCEDLFDVDAITQQPAP